MWRGLSKKMNIFLKLFVKVIIFLKTPYSIKKLRVTHKWPHDVLPMTSEFAREIVIGGGGGVNLNEGH